MTQRTDAVRRAGNRGAGGEPSARELLERGEGVREDLGSLAGAVGDVTRGCRTLLREHLESQPYATLAIATGIGYVLGGGVPTAVARLLIGLGGRFAVEQLLVRFATNRSQ